MKRAVRIAARMGAIAVVLSTLAGCNGTLDDKAKASGSAKVSGAKDSAAATSEPSQAPPSTAAEDPRAWCWLADWQAPLCPEENASFLKGAFKSPTYGVPVEEGSMRAEFHFNNLIRAGAPGSAKLDLIIWALSDIQDPALRQRQAEEAKVRCDGMESTTFSGVPAEFCYATDTSLTWIGLHWERDGRAFQLEYLGPEKFTAADFLAAASEWPYDASVWGPVHSTGNDITTAIWKVFGQGSRHLSDKHLDCLTDGAAKSVGADALHAWENSPEKTVTDPDMSGKLTDVITGCMSMTEFLYASRWASVEPDSTFWACLADVIGDDPEMYDLLVSSALAGNKDYPTIFGLDFAHCQQVELDQMTPPSA